MDAERHADAVALLSEQPDDVHPVDWAWMLTQRARARAELGEVAPARQDAAAALRALVGDPDDVTASAIGAAAAELLFQTAPWGKSRSTSSSRPLTPRSPVAHTIRVDRPPDRRRPHLPAMG